MSTPDTTLLGLSHLHLKALCMFSLQLKREILCFPFQKKVLDSFPFSATDHQMFLLL